LFNIGLTRVNQTVQLLLGTDFYLSFYTHVKFRQKFTHGHMWTLMTQCPHECSSEVSL